jgi:hypothetical protein
VLYVGSIKENSFSKVLRSLFGKTKLISVLKNKRKKKVKKGCWSWSTNGSCLAAATVTTSAGLQNGSMATTMAACPHQSPLFFNLF